MDWYQIAWLVVALVILLIVLAWTVRSLLDKLAEMYQMTLHAERTLAITRYGVSLQAQSHWFNGLDRLVAQAIAEDMKEGNWTPNVSKISDKHKVK